MRNLLLILFVCFCCVGLLQAQTVQPAYKYAVKLSNLSTYTYSRVRDSNGNVISGGSLQVFKPVPGFLRRGLKGNLLELNLNNIHFNLLSRRTEGITTYRPYSLGLGVKVGYFYAFMKRNPHKLVPLLGIEILPYVQANLNRNRISGTDIIYRAQQVGATAILSPRVMWHAGSRFFIDASINLNFFSIEYYHYRRSDPSNASTVTELSRLGMRIPSDLGIQIGFGVKL